MGLAIYNSSTLPIYLPPVFYKMLVGEESQALLEDVRAVDPQLHSGLSALLAHEPSEDVEEVHVCVCVRPVCVCVQEYVSACATGQVLISAFRLDDL